MNKLNVTEKSSNLWQIETHEFALSHPKELPMYIGGGVCLKLHGERISKNMTIFHVCFLPQNHEEGVSLTHKCGICNKIF